MQPQRLSTGGAIERTRSISFRFNGRRLSGFRGDTLASALLANGVHFVARSVRFHRARGILSAGPEEPSALVTCRVGDKVATPNLKVTEVALVDGLEAWSQNCWPTLRWDAGAVMQFFSPLLIAGFYYKTFMWPNGWWHGYYERVIRRVAGQGRVALREDASTYDKRHLTCDALIVGSGRSGVAAALRAAAEGGAVVVLEQDDCLGGRASWDTGRGGVHASLQHAQEVEQLRRLPNVRCMNNTLAFGHYDRDLVLARERGNDGAPTTLWKIRARRVEFAAGAIEQPLVFSGNDRPGVMLAGAARKYVRRYAVQPGQRAFVATMHAQDRQLTESALRDANVELAGNLTAGERIVATRGRHRLSGVRIADGTGRSRWVPCDLLCVSGGWITNLQLSGHLNAAVPPSPCPHNDLSAVTISADDATAFIDLQGDVTRRDLAIAVREGYSHAELAKRYTTLGMGTDQGRTSWFNGLRELAALSGSDTDEKAPPRSRPPVSPIEFGVIAGAQTGAMLAPVRRTPFHQAFEAAGCVFTDAGTWRYARHFPRRGESMQACVEREVLAVRNGVGCVDMSTLGKIEVKGRDAREFLARIYCNKVETVRPGQVRYALMLREDGVVYDDGTLAQLGKDHFVVTTSTAKADAVWRWFRQCQQLRWPELDVHMVRVTEQWATLAIAGPKSAALLSEFETDFAIDAESFPYGRVREGSLNRIPCRVYTTSYSGERCYEINVPAGFAEELFRQVSNYGARHDLTPYGLEALDVLRIEKGHIAAGAEIDGRSTPADLGLGQLIARDKPFIGAALLQRPALQRTDRPQFVGLTPCDNLASIPTGAMLTGQPWSATRPQRPEGRLTAAIASPTHGHDIALALLNGGHARLGERLLAVSPLEERCVAVTVAPACSYDPAGARLRG